METPEIVSLMVGAAWASGINLYATVLIVGWLGGAGYVELPPDLRVLSSPEVLSAAGIMYAIEFLVDKIPGLDTLWDALHTFVRIPAGALIAAGAANGLGASDTTEAAAMLLGGLVAGGAHATKASTRALLNTSPEPFSNWAASIAEDLTVLGGLWAALHYPWAFLTLWLIFALLSIWLLPKLFRIVKRLWYPMWNRFAGTTEKPHTITADSSRVPTPKAEMPHCIKAPGPNTLGGNPRPPLDNRIDE